MSLNKGFVTARFITLMFTEVFMDGFDVVPQSSNTLEHKATLIACLWVLFIGWILH